MSALLTSLVFWHWLTLGVVLMTAEALLPGGFLLWFGAGALATGVLLLLVPALPWQAQWVAFAVISLVSIVWWRRHGGSLARPHSHPALNQRGAQYVGRRFTLSEAIVDGVGRLHVDDTMWRVEGVDLPVGAAVMVIGVDGNALRVVVCDPDAGAGH
jgi:membrane protein implicated in regulation of membrane protease activity